MFAAGKVIVPDKWKAGSKNVERKINVNMLLINKEKKAKGASLASIASIHVNHLSVVSFLTAADYRTPCRICKVVTEGAYCQACAYKKGICNCCGKKIIDTKMYKQSSK